MYTDYEHLYYNSLYHSRVKGMKWGIRKDSKRTASLRQQYHSEKDKKKYNTLLVGEHMFLRSRGVDTSDGALFRKSFQATGKLKIASPNDFNRAATNYYKRTNDSSKGLKEASILENKYNADRLLYGNRSLY